MSDIWNIIFNTIKVNLIDDVSFKVLEYHSAKQLSGGGLLFFVIRLFWSAVCFFYHLFLAEFFDLQFWLWFCLDLMLLNKGYSVFKHI